MIYLWWLGGAIALALIELLIVDLTFLMLGVGALAAALFAWFVPDSLWGQVAVFVLVSLACLFALKPWLKSHMEKSIPNLRTNASALIGKSVKVAETVTPDNGYVRIDGQVWSARSSDNEVIEAGSAAYVVRVDGATVIVRTSAEPTIEKSNSNVY